MAAPAKKAEGPDFKNSNKLQLNPSPAIPAPEFKQGYIQLGPECSPVNMLLLNFTVQRAIEMELVIFI